ncbi:MAG: S1 RNA-binding domain-containing protein [bacterium]|nr:S1 RNA-binding domain-containing protein [bacterium]
MKYEDGKIVKGCVTGIESYGIFMSFDEYYTGLIHISEISNGFVRNINDFVDIGETIKARIIDVDHKNFQLKLTIKDIDYRIASKKKEKIHETGTGFYLLGENLKKWISQKSEK